jgi:hypothetical protein
MKNFLLFGFLTTGMLAAAQNKDIRSANFSKMPYWIEMIKNPNVNYYDAVNAYEEFWKGKKNPLNEALAGQDTQASNLPRQTGLDKKERILYLKYFSECKKFESWKNAVKLNVQPDGRIVSKTN